MRCKQIGSPKSKDGALLRDGKDRDTENESEKMTRWKQTEVRLPQAKNSPGCFRAGGGKEGYLQGSAAHSQK